VTATEEVRVTSETGGMKGSKPAQLGGIDPLALLHLGEVSGYGAKKYENPFNFLLGYDWDLSYNAIQRHLLAFWSGEDFDDESGLAHVVHAAWHCLALFSFMHRGAGRDTRPTEVNLIELATKMREAADVAVGNDAIEGVVVTQHQSTEMVDRQGDTWVKLEAEDDLWILLANAHEDVFEAMLSPTRLRLSSEALLKAYGPLTPA
jgi:hypothetical protein